MAKRLRFKMSKASSLRSALLSSIFFVSCWLVGATSNANGQWMLRAPGNSDPLTLTGGFAKRSFVVLAKPITVPRTPDGKVTIEFEIVRVLKGDQQLKSGIRFHTDVARHLLDNPLMLITGGEKTVDDKPAIVWDLPMGVGAQDANELALLVDFKPSGTARLKHFQTLLEHPTELIARNAHLEFAVASDADLIGLKDQMRHDQLVAWVKDLEVVDARKHLYLSMLAVCNEAADAVWIEEMLKNKNLREGSILPSLIWTYLSIQGPEGLPLINDLFLRKDSVTYLEVMHAATALRHMSRLESTKISKKQFIASFRLVLDRPRMADMVVRDLVDLEDWESLEKLSRLYKDAPIDEAWVRVPAIMFAKKCPRPESKEVLEMFEKIDPDAFERANFFDSDLPDEQVAESKTEDDAPATETTGETLPLFLRPTKRSFVRGFGFGC